MSDEVILEFHTACDGLLKRKELALQFYALRSFHVETPYFQEQLGEYVKLYGDRFGGSGIDVVVDKVFKPINSIVKTCIVKYRVIFKTKHHVNKLKLQRPEAYQFLMDKVERGISDTNALREDNAFVVLNSNGEKIATTETIEQCLKM